MTATLANLTNTTSAQRRIQGCADTNGTNIKAATADGCVGVLGDARREEVLRQAALPAAQRVVVAADRESIDALAGAQAEGRAQQALGNKFDFRKFNDALVMGGGVPMVVLARNIDAFIAKG